MRTCPSCKPLAACATSSAITAAIPSRRPRCSRRCTIGSSPPFTSSRPNARFQSYPSNAFAERFVGSVKSECLTRIVPLGERHLRTAVRAFADHYHEERPHQGLGNECIAPKTTLIGTGSVRCRERLGGVL